MTDLRGEFRRLESSGYLGPPDGDDAYAYLRASSERQVEEGSSFPRQLDSVQKAAVRDNLRVPFDLILFDDGFSGFEFEHRPALLKLRHEVHSEPRATHLVVEDIDRLSRNADWQQGYLLEEFARRGVQVHFFTHPGSQLERYVRGYIAQEGMRKDLERMRMGNIYKAMDGKVTARRPSYGYVITDARQSYYELLPEEARVVRWIYEKIIYEGWSLYEIAKEINALGIPTRFSTGYWKPSTIYQLVKSPVYKGEFCANRTYKVPTGEFTRKGKPKKITKTRLPSEWIRVPVPPIVTPEEWDLAAEQLRKNASRSLRNAKKHDWLLSGFLRCQICQDYSVVSRISNSRRYYMCNSRYSEKAKRQGKACLSPYLSASDLERRVWETIQEVVYNPDLLLRRLEARSPGLRLQRELDLIDGQLGQIGNQKSKFEEAYLRDIYTLDEFEEKMRRLSKDVRELERLRRGVVGDMATEQSLEVQRRIVKAGLRRIRDELAKAQRERRLPRLVSFELKRKILALLVDTIWVDAEVGTFTIEGAVKGSYEIASAEQTYMLSSPSFEIEPELAFASVPKPRSP